MTSTGSEKSLKQREYLDQVAKQNENTQIDEINVLNIVNAQLDNLHNNSTASFLETQKKVVEKWNKITTCIIDGQRLVIDRSSWLAKNGIYIKYTSDTMGYPMYLNIMFISCHIYN